MSEIVGIVGSEAAKFTTDTEEIARATIRQILSQPGVLIYCSGHCHLGGVDIWTEEEGDKLGLTPLIFAPEVLSWTNGYKPRNLKIADASHEVHVIIVKELPLDYKGMRFEKCYHCRDRRPPHQKSGGCWTAIQAQRLGKPAFWHIV